MSKELLEQCLEALSDADKYRALIGRICYINSEETITKEILDYEADIPGGSVFKDRAQHQIAKDIGMFLLREGHIRFIELDDERGFVSIRGTIEIVRPE